jgi:CheY-like chemotaxis protein
MELRLDILFADDDLNDRALLGTAVHKTDLNIWLHTVADGEQAIDYLEGRGVYADRSLYAVPNLLILDLNMRLTDGFEFLDWRRSSRSFSSLPVVLFSGVAYKGAIDEALAMGASRFIPKPSEFDGWKAVAREIWDFGMECRNQAAEPLGGERHL